jgi:hypothetical protein
MLVWQRTEATLVKWFRMYHDALHDPKVQQLPAEQFRVWFNLLCMASANPRRGYLPPVKDIAYTLRLSMVRASACVTALVEAGLLDRDEAGNLRPHNWDARQFKTDDVNERSRKSRGKKADPTPDPPPDAPLPATLQKEDLQRSPASDRNVAEDVACNGISSARADSDSDSDSETESDSASNDAEPGGGRKPNYLFISEEHRATIEHARRRRGDDFAFEVSDRGREIEFDAEGRWDYYRYGIDQSVHCRTPINEAHKWIMGVVRKCKKLGGIPKTSMALEPMPATVKLNPSRISRTIAAFDDPPRDTKERA